MRKSNQRMKGKKRMRKSKNKSDNEVKQKKT